jgi:G3E family GTPase
VRVPAILLTGFLGSGKTTLLNRLLAHRQQLPAPPRGKLAVLVNELGSVGIDASLLPAGAARQVELPGGCICCTLDENMADSLTELLDAEPTIEWVVIETTGIAEPLPIVWTLTGDRLASRVRLTAVVTVVDALEHERHRPLSPSVDAQVEHADILVVSKRDALADAGQLDGLLATLRRANPTAAILTESDPEASAAALWQILSDGAADTALSPGVRPHSMRIDTTASVHEGHTHGDSGHSHEHGDRALDGAREARSTAAIHGFESVAVSIDGTLDFEELTAQLEELPASYIRIKGICWAIDPEAGSATPALIAFHRVGARVSAEPIGALAVGDPVPRAVALGTGIDGARLAACLRAAMVPCEG